MTIRFTPCSVLFSTMLGIKPRTRIRTSNGTQETHSTVRMSRKPCSFHRSGASPMFTRCSIHRKYPAVRIVPIPPRIMNARKRPTFNPATVLVFGLNEPRSAITSPQNPARPGRPNDAIATKAKIPDIFGMISDMPPPMSAI